MSLRQNFVAFILAAGKGTRIQEFTDTPKVLLKLKGKTLLQYAIDHISNFEIEPIIVVSYKKDEIINEIGEYKYVEQIGFPGTGGALMAGIKGLKDFSISNDIRNIIVLQGDDTAFLEDSTLSGLMTKHIESNSVITLLTTKRDDPTGFGRIVRLDSGKFQKIVEQKNANESEKIITEVNTGVWCFNREWLCSSIIDIKPNSISNEYYATDLIEIACNNKQSISTFLCPSNQFFGINTKEQYFEAKERMED